MKLIRTAGRTTENASWVVKIPAFFTTGENIELLRTLRGLGMGRFSQVLARVRSEKILQDLERTFLLSLLELPEFC